MLIVHSATSLSDRLAEVERKLTAFQKSQHVELLQSRPVSHANEDSGAQYDDGGHPIVHTGAASRLLYCWSRIGVMCTLPNLDPFTCLDEATEHASDAYSQLVASGESAEVFDQHASEGRLEQAVDSLATNGMGRLPSRLGVLLRHYIGFDVAKLRVNLPLVNGSQKPSSSLAFNDLCIATVAFLSAEGSTLGAVAGLQLLLARSWSLHTLSADYSVPGMLLLGSLLDTLALAPVQALGLLHVAGNIIERASRVAPVPPAYEKLKFILECDLLTEVDGGKDSYYEALVRDKVPALGRESGRLGAGCDPMDSVLDQSVQLRVIHNAILTQLYSIDMAYCKPLEVADRVLKLRRHLDDWYGKLPANRRFARDLTCFYHTTAPTFDDLGRPCCVVMLCILTPHPGRDGYQVLLLSILSQSPDLVFCDA